MALAIGAYRQYIPMSRAMGPGTGMSASKLFANLPAFIYRSSQSLISPQPPALSGVLSDPELLYFPPAFWYLSGWHTSVGHMTETDPNVLTL